MSTTYTEHYNFGKQEDYSDLFSMKVITDNWDSLDDLLWAFNSAKQNTIDSEHPIDGTEVRLGTYSKATTKQDIAENDTIKTALGKVEKRIEDNENNIYSNQNNGVKNILSYDLQYLKSKNTSGSWNNNVYTVANTVFTINSDGSIKVTGHPSSQSVWLYLRASDIALKSGCIISGCPVGGSYASSYVLAAYNNNEQRIGTDTGSGATITQDATAGYIEIGIYSTHDGSELLFKPMLREFGDDTFVPYALSNAELTADMSEIQTGLGAVCVFRAIKNASATYTYTMTMDDFRVSPSIANCGTYLVNIVSWSTTPTYSLYAVSYSGGNITDYNVVQKIAGTDATVTCTNGVISITSSGKVQIFALR